MHWKSMLSVRRNSCCELLENRLLLTSIPFTEHLLVPDSQKLDGPEYFVDMDIDGDLDLVSVKGDHLTWYENVDHGANFDIRIQTINHRLYRDQKFADIDLDGDVDILTLNRFSDPGISWIEQVNGVFSQLHPIDQSTDSVWPIDMDTDGDVDLLASSRHFNSVFWYENVDANFSQIHVIQKDIPGTAIRDFKVSNSNMEILLSRPNGLILLRHDDAGVWEEKQVSSESFGVAKLTDITADESLQVIAGNSNEVIVYKESGNFFDAQQTIEFAVPGTKELDVQDFNQDGILDLVISSFRRRELHLGLVNGTFGPASNLTQLSGDFVDIDGDGDPDFVASDFWQENNDGQFGPERKIVDYQHRSLGMTSRVNLDDHPDIILKQGGGLVRHLQNDDHQLGQAQEIVSQIDMDFISSDFDLGNDGDDDLLAWSVRCGLPECSTLQIVENQSESGKFNEPQIIDQITGQIYDSKVIDFDGDGDDDIVVSHAEFTQTDKWRLAFYVAWYEQAENGFLDRQVVFESAKALPKFDLIPISSNEFFLVTENDILRLNKDSVVPFQTLSDGDFYGYADLNNDGFLDLIRSDGWYPNLENQRFGTVVSIDLPRRIHHLAPADINLDGHVDLVTFGGSISWLENQGNGIFTSNHAVAANAVRLFEGGIVDFDGDGDFDILARSSLHGAPIWLRNEIIELDLNLDQSISTDDVDFLSHQIASGITPARFDLNNDKIVNLLDLDRFAELLELEIGDVNVDGRFDSRDLVKLFQVGEYDDGMEKNSVWTTGDWNADGEFDSGDLVRAFTLGNYHHAPESPQTESGRFDETSILFDGGDRLPRSVKHARLLDMDGDQVKDLIVVNHEGIFLSRNQSESFGKAQQFFVGSVRSIAIGDLDGDTDNDVVFHANDELRWLENRGDASFQNAKILALVEESQTSILKLEDVNGDDLLDIIHHFRSSIRKATLYINSGEGSVLGHDITPSTSDERPLAHIKNAESIHAIDMDRDSDVDFVFLTIGGVLWLENSDGQGMEFDVHEVPLGLDPKAIAFGDVNGDAKLDFVTSNSRGRLDVFIRSETGFEIHQQIDDSVSCQVCELDLIDLDSDGDLDLTRMQRNGWEWYENQAGEFLTKVFEPASADSRVLLSDLWGDESPELVIVEPNGDLRQFEFNNNTAGFVPVQKESSDLIRSSVVADIDGDGNQDVVTVHNNGDSLFWQRNLGQRQFSTPMPLPIPALQMDLIEATDFDSDGDDDFVMSTQYGRELKLLLNGSNGQDWEAFQIDVSDVPRYTLLDVEIADINQDGKFDIVASWSQHDKMLVLYQGTDGGDFDSKILFAQSDKTLDFDRIHVLDWDQDDDLDVVGTAYWFENRLLDDFQRHRLELSQSLVQFSDLDGDSDFDAVGFSSRVVAVSYFDQFGVFDRVSRTVTKFVPFDLALRDLDRDGDDDLLIGYSGNSHLLSFPSGPNDLIWQENVGDFQFASPRAVGSSLQITSMAMVDLDNDGFVDILETSSLSNDVTVRWNSAVVKPPSE